MAESEKAPSSLPSAQTSDELQSRGDSVGQQSGHHDDEKTKQDKKEKKEEKKKSKENKPPAGGYDPTPIAHAPPGYTIKFTFHKATNLPMADINSLSSDPYVLAQLNTGLPPRHKEDPLLRFRTQTIRRNTDPVWETEWIVANVPASGFKLKCRIYDEDPADHDDRLGNVHVTVSRIDENWTGIKNEQFKIKKRMGSKRAYLVRGIAKCIRTVEHMNGFFFMSAELLGRTEDDEGGRCYTVGPPWWTMHYSPLLGRIANRKEPRQEQEGQDGQESNGKKKKKTESYNFQANQMQLAGPVPAELYHRFVEFKPFVKGLFTNKGPRGMLLSKTLHHQHARVYNFDRSTKYGVFKGPGKEVTQKFLELVHYDQGGRIFTYVLSLDALFRFTETGKEFGIDMLSKHTMHSDVSIYIAFSGEFFIRRLKHKSSHVSKDDQSETHPPADIGGGPPEGDPPKDPEHYELVIDNDSGTYRPNAKLLPLLKEFMQKNLPGLKIITLDSQADAERMGKMKQEQRDRKKKEGDNIVYTQGNFSDSSLSSSDEEDLDNMQHGSAHERGMASQIGQQAEYKYKKEMTHMKNIYGFGPGRGGDDETEGPSSSQPTAV